MRWKSINKYYYKFSYFFPKTSKQKIIFSLILERMARDYFLMKRDIFLAKDDIQNTSSRCHSRHSLPMPKWSLSIPFNKSLLPSLIFSQYIQLIFTDHLLCQYPEISDRILGLTNTVLSVTFLHGLYPISHLPFRSNCYSSVLLSLTQPRPFVDSYIIFFILLSASLDMNLDIFILLFKSCFPL